jgi:uncharacterized delta-60 repeat protein
MVLRSDGRIILAGRTFNNGTYDFLMVGLMPDGTPDTTFGNGGFVKTDFGGTNECIYSIRLVANDKILVTGNKEFGTSYFIAARFYENGILDPLFGNNGFTVISSGNRLDKCNAFALQSDSSIVLAGTHHNSSTDEYMIARLNSDGFVDTTFGSGGMLLIPTTNSNDAINDLLVQYDDRILLAGSGKGQQPIIIRLNPDGAIDTTFGNMGYYAANSGSSINSLSSILIMSDSSIITAGFSYNGIDDDFLVSKALIDYTSGIKNVEKKFTLSVFPNPAHEYISISFLSMIDEPGMISIFSARGTLIQNNKFGFLTSPVTVGLPELTPGIYYVLIKTQNTFLTNQFIVQ